MARSSAWTWWCSVLEWRHGLSSLRELSAASRETKQELWCVIPSCNLLRRTSLLLATSAPSHIGKLAGTPGLSTGATLLTRAHMRPTTCSASLFHTATHPSTGLGTTTRAFNMSATANPTTRSTSTETSSLISLLLTISKMARSRPSLARAAQPISHHVRSIQPKQGTKP